MKKLKKIVFVIFTMIVIFYFITALQIYSYSKIDETTRADAAIILGTAVWDNQPSPVFKERINHAILLYKMDSVEYLIFTGGIGEGKKYSEAEIGKKYAIENEIPENKIFIEEKSTITDENLKYAKEIIEQNNFSKVLIVSDPLHMKRAMLMAKSHDINAYSSPTKTSRYISFKSKFGFVMRETFFYIGYKICSPA
ncbi:YdcF family protein [Moheibacter lacus]|uniref:YdcF family protein n=1 Tax=Moheibacter lacus TaxID=2745851 RepID=A0A838ZR13_9FLAO|nr:YdcF family protein [Moheibacter lacus]MBA5628632.1 YdcF family protein [Moheibacter lacus]